MSTTVSTVTPRPLKPISDQVNYQAAQQQVQAPSSAPTPANSYSSDSEAASTTVSTSSANTPVTPPAPRAPKSVAYTPPSSVTPSYSPKQPKAVEETRSNNRVQQQQVSAVQKQQVAKQPIQMADHRVASSVLTGEYGPNATQHQGAPRVGGYLASTA